MIEEIKNKEDLCLYVLFDIIKLLLSQKDTFWKLYRYDGVRCLRLEA